ncbi:unnamed protein product, partial [Ectocarpus sp. 12 AP-2014]
GFSSSARRASSSLELRSIASRYRPSSRSSPETTGAAPAPPAGPRGADHRRGEKDVSPGIGASGVTTGTSFLRRSSLSRASRACSWSRFPEASADAGLSVTATPRVGVKSSGDDMTNGGEAAPAPPPTVLLRSSRSRASRACSWSRFPDASASAGVSTTGARAGVVDLAGDAPRSRLAGDDVGRRG